MGLKECTKCKIEKEYSEFGKRNESKDGLEPLCKSCKKEYNKKHYQANKERAKEYSKQYREANKKHIKEYYQANKERTKERKKEYYQANKKHIKERTKKYYQANKEHRNEYERKRRKTDPLFKLKKLLRTRTSMAFKKKGYSKNTKTQEMLGVDWKIYKAHIERQFTKGMNWSNQGEWHIDHIIPLASAKTPERLKQLCHYTNLQPLWAEDNLSKSDSINGQQTMIRI